MTSIPGNSRSAAVGSWGGVGALLVASGQAAETLSILNVAEAGDHVVSSPSLYGRTYNLFHYTLPKLGIDVSFMGDPDGPQAWQDAVRPNTNCGLRSPWNAPFWKFR